MTNTLDRIEALFEAALSQPPEERKAFLREHCGDDETLFDEVVSLLAADARAGTNIDRPIFYSSTDTPSGFAGLSFEPGDRVGRYEILEQLGEGGFAVVYLAQQSEPVRRRVALKILKPGMDTKEVLARFEAERQALAMMDHPHIAKVFDAGATEQGRPYFAMEYVDGTPITDYCDEYRLSIKDRLMLFIQLCEAVQHAHTKAIIHRDLKPSNVLVCGTDERSSPKVIDFGVAKAIEQKLTPDTIYTQRGALIGTPAYMSPEQVGDDHLDIDTRVDVYALGVILFQLLVGKLPFSRSRSEESEVSELLRAIREDEPPRPSALVVPEAQGAMETARRRRTEAPALRREVSGDLDWITLMALAKERDRRYDSPKRLAEDIDRYLTDQPVLARPPSVAYRTGKFVRRHMGAVIATVASVLFLTIFAITMAVQADRERRARAELAQVVEFQADRLSAIDVQRMGVRMRRALLAEVQTATRRTGLTAPALDQRMSAFERQLAGTNFTNLALRTLDENIFATAIEAAEKRFTDQPLVKARLLQSLADEMRKAGLLEKASPPQAEALTIRRHLLSANHPDILSSINSMGLLLQDQGKLVEAERYLREALEGRRRVLGDQHRDTLASLDAVGNLLFVQGELAEAETYFRTALDGRRRLQGSDHPDTLTTLNDLGTTAMMQGRLDEAERLFRQALAGRRRVLGSEHLGTLSSLSTMGYLFMTQDKPAEAERFYSEALAGRRRILGDDHPATLTMSANLAFVLMKQGKLAEAESHYRIAVEGVRRVLGAEHQATLTFSGNMGALLTQQKRYSEAESVLRENVEGRAKFYGENHWKTADARSLLGEALTGLGRYEEAETSLLEGYAGLAASSLPAGRRKRKLGLAAERLEVLYSTWGEPEQAAEWRAKRPTE